MASVVNQGWCDLIPNLLDLPEHDAREKVLAAMWTLRDACTRNFLRAAPVLRRLKAEYLELSEIEKLEDDDLYFSGLLGTIDHLLVHTVGAFVNREDL